MITIDVVMIIGLGTTAAAAVVNITMVGVSNFIMIIIAIITTTIIIAIINAIIIIIIIIINAIIMYTIYSIETYPDS